MGEGKNHVLFIFPKPFDSEDVELLERQVREVGVRRFVGQRVAVDVDTVAESHLQVSAQQRHVVRPARDALRRLRRQHDLLHSKTSFMRDVKKQRFVPANATNFRS